MTEAQYVQDALDAWEAIVAEKYDDARPTPRGIAADLEVYMNGNLLFRSVGQLRSLWREVQRRFPDWENDIIQAFGDSAGQCTVWHATGTAGDGSATRLDLHGVTILESTEGIIHSAKFYYETGMEEAMFADGLGMRPVAS